MTPRHYILATAGHVDHGKSSLVRALTGTDPDRLPEEKQRGITIDLGFAHFEIPTPAGLCSVGVVDVPGHEDFVKNMVAGVGAVDCALLVVAADDGWMPQTEEHLQILEYLGVRHGVVALTKVDLPDADVELASEDIRERIAGSSLAAARIVPVSSVTGAGLPALTQALADVLGALPVQMGADKPRLAIDRVFTVRGMGTVVTGTLAGGSLHNGQSVALQPAGRMARIRSLQSHNREVATVTPGTRTAMGLSDLSREEVQRGDQVTLTNLGAASDTVEVLLHRSARLPARTRLLKSSARVQVHQGSASHPARLIFLADTELGAGQSALAQLRFEQPVFMLAGDRVVLRDGSQTATLAGGVVLDPNATRRDCRQVSRMRCLERCAEALDTPSEWVAAILERDGAAQQSLLLRQSSFSSAAVSAAVAGLVAVGRVQVLGDWWVEVERLRSLSQTAANVIDAEHRAHPDRAGVDVERVRACVRKAFASADVAEIFLEEFCRSGVFKRTGAVVARVTHRLALPPDLVQAAQRLREALRAAPLEPPARKELETGPAAVRALRFLVETGEAVEVGVDLVLGAVAFAEASRRVQDFLRTHGAAKASDLRDALGTSRRVIIPLLERLDRDRVTVRQGDLRRLPD